METSTEPKLFISSSIANNLPAMVRNELARLSAQKQQEFLEEYDRNKKSVGFAYLLWFFLGWHYAYQRKWGIQFLYWFTVGGVGIWALIDIFRVPGMIRGYNKDRAIDVMRNLVAISSRM
jgi:hypothetical protein